MTYGDNSYEIKVRLNGQVVSLLRVVAEAAPHEAELEVLNRMGTDIIRELRNKETHKGCCDCCEKKKCQKY